MQYYGYPALSSSSTGGGAATSTGEDQPEKSSFSTLDVIVVVIVVLLILAAAVFGFLYWRKRKYGLNSLFESGSASRPDGRRLLLDDGPSSTLA